MKYLIATGTIPKEFGMFFKVLRESAAEAGLTIPAFLFCPGPGCNNLAFEIQGDETEAERFVGYLAIALQPAKYCQTTDKIPSEDTVIHP